jgi:hypothetical protein
VNIRRRESLFDDYALGRFKSLKLFRTVADLVGHMRVTGQRVLKRKVRFETLGKEMEAIHFADKLYCSAALPPDREAKAEHKRGQDRLEEIRRELALLRN